MPPPPPPPSPRPQLPARRPLRRGDLGASGLGGLCLQLCTLAWCGWGDPNGHATLCSTALHRRPARPPAPTSRGRLWKGGVEGAGTGSGLCGRRGPPQEPSRVRRARVPACFAESSRETRSTRLRDVPAHRTQGQRGRSTRPSMNRSTRLSMNSTRPVNAANKQVNAADDNVNAAGQRGQ